MSMTCLARAQLAQLCEQLQHLCAQIFFLFLGAALLLLLKFLVGIRFAVEHLKISAAFEVSATAAMTIIVTAKIKSFFY